MVDKGVPAVLADTTRVTQVLVNLVGMLQRIGCHVTVASDGAEGVEKALAGGFDVILMDRQMPGMDGCEATRKILAQLGKAAPPIVALTAASTEGDRSDCLAAGMVDYLTKPLRSTDLAQALRPWLDVDERAERAAGNSAAG